VSIETAQKGQCASGCGLQGGTGITLRNLQRWKREGGLLQRDRRVDAVRPRLAHALTNEEQQAVLAVANEARIADCHRPAHRSQLMIGTMEPATDRHIGASAGSA